MLLQYISYNSAVTTALLERCENRASAWHSKQFSITLGWLFHLGEHSLALAAYYDICYDMGKNKCECNRQMVDSLDQISYGEMTKWGQTIRFLINTKQKLVLGTKKSKNGKVVE